MIKNIIEKTERMVKGRVVNFFKDNIKEGELHYEKYKRYEDIKHICEGRLES